MILFSLNKNYPECCDSAQNPNCEYKAVQLGFIKTNNNFS